MSDRDYVAPPRIVVALCVIALGVWWTAANLGWAAPVDLGKYWPVILIVIGLAKVASASAAPGRLWGAMIAILGGWIMVDRLYNIPFHIDDWWPVLLIGWGVLLLMGGSRRRGSSATMGEGTPGRSSAAGSGGTFPGSAAAEAAPRGTPSVDDTVSAFAIWSGCRRRIASATFRRADLAAVMGGVTLDLRQASTATGEAVVDVFVVWGGINIRVPPDWVVSNEVVAIMGGTDDRSTGTQPARHRLIVRGYVMMGGIEIKP